MSRAARLLDLVQILRRHRRPVAGAVLAAELGVSLRTLYRDVATLQGQGAPIEGEAGVGYVLRSGWVISALPQSIHLPMGCKAGQRNRDARCPSRS